MPRLVTFGCSHTYGTGLPDCINTSNPGKNIKLYIKHVTGSGDLHSQLAWPTVLANMLGYDLLNLSSPGAGNREIRDKIITTDFYEEDFIIIMWSYFTRFNFFKYGEHKTFRVDFTSKYYTNVVVNEDPTAYRMFDNAMQNFFAIEFSSMWLRQKGLKFYSLFAIEDFFKFKTPNFIHKENVIKQPLTDFVIDKALDNQHFGIESHKLLASLIYDKIKIK